LLSAISDRRDGSFWRRSLRVPVPAVAAALIVLVTLIAWSVLAGMWRHSVASQSVTRVTPTPAGDTAVNTPPGANLARFDHGDRLIIYKEPRVQERDSLR
jgi:hypothetical protein